MISVIDLLKKLIYLVECTSIEHVYILLSQAINQYEQSKKEYQEDELRYELTHQRDEQEKREDENS